VFNNGNLTIKLYNNIKVKFFLLDDRFCYFSQLFYHSKQTNQSKVVKSACQATNFKEEYVIQKKNNKFTKKILLHFIISNVTVLTQF